MSKNNQEMYNIETDDKELHVISVMLESLSRHLTNKNGTTSENYEDWLKQRRQRVVKYVLDRVNDKW